MIELIKEKDLTDTADILLCDKRDNIYNVNVTDYLYSNRYCNTSTMNVTVINRDDIIKKVLNEFIVLVFSDNSLLDKGSCLAKFKLYGYGVIAVYVSNLIDINGTKYIDLDVSFIGDIEQFNYHGFYLRREYDDKADLNTMTEQIRLDIIDNIVSEKYNNRFPQMINVMIKMAERGIEYTKQATNLY